MRRLCLYIFCAFVFSIPWQNAVSIGGSRTFSALLGVGALWLTLSVVLAEWRLRRPPALLLLMALFAAWQIATIVWSLDQSMTVQRAVTLIQLLGMVWLVGELGESEGQRRWLMQAFVLGCFVVVAALLQSWASGVPVEGYRYAPKSFNLNETADTLAVGIVMALILVTRSQSKLLYWINIAFIPLAVVAVVATGSRSGFIATCIALLGVPFALGTARAAYRAAWLVFITGTFALLFFAVPQNHTLEQNLRRVTFFEETETVQTMTGRTIIWSAGYAVFKEHPAGGIGAGTFSKGVAYRLDRARSPHNLFVSVAVETGIVGLLLVLGVLVSALVPVVSARGEPRGLYLVLFAVLMATAFVANVDTSKVLWFGLALLSMTGRRAGTAPETAQAAARDHAGPPGQPLRPHPLAE